MIRLKIYILLGLGIVPLLLGGNLQAQNIKITSYTKTFTFGGENYYIHVNKAENSPNYEFKLTKEAVLSAQSAKVEFSLIQLEEVAFETEFLKAFQELETQALQEEIEGLEKQIGEVNEKIVENDTSTNITNLTTLKNELEGKLNVAKTSLDGQTKKYLNKSKDEISGLTDSDLQNLLNNSSSVKVDDLKKELESNSHSIYSEIQEIKKDKISLEIELKNEKDKDPKTQSTIDNLTSDIEAKDDKLKEQEKKRTDIQKLINILDSGYVSKTYKLKASLLDQGIFKDINFSIQIDTDRPLAGVFCVNREINRVLVSPSAKYTLPHPRRLEKRLFKITQAFKLDIELETLELLTYEIMMEKIKEKAIDEYGRSTVIDENNFDPKEYYILKFKKDGKTKIARLKKALKCARIFRKKADSLILNAQLKIEKVILQIEEGYIEEMTVEGKVVDGGKFVFENVMPIPISSIVNAQSFGKIWLHEKLGANYFSSQKRHILLSDVLSYKPHLLNRRRDYSPGDTLLMLEGGQCRQMYKKSVQELLQARLFTDFIGFDQNAENPNGLVQTELSHRFNILTKRWTGFGACFRWFMPRYINHGYIEYLEPELVVSKIESNNRRLRLKSEVSLVNNEIVENKFTSSLDLLQYEHFSVGGKLNLYVVDIPNLKTTFFLNVGGYFGRTAIEDSSLTLNNGQITGSLTEFNVNTFRIFPEAVILVEAGGRVDLRVSYRAMYYNLQDARFRQVANIDQFQNTGSVGREEWISNIEFMTRFSPNARSDWFFRFRLFSQWGNWNNNFSQWQVGHTFHIFRRR